MVEKYHIEGREKKSFVRARWEVSESAVTACCGLWTVQWQRVAGCGQCGDSVLRVVDSAVTACCGLWTVRWERDASCGQCGDSVLRDVDSAVRVWCGLWTVQWQCVAGCGQCGESVLRVAAIRRWNDVKERSIMKYFFYFAQFYNRDLTLYSPVVTICTASLTFNNSTFCPHSVFFCFVWISEQAVIISLYNINWLVFITEI